MTFGKGDSCAIFLVLVVWHLSLSTQDDMIFVAEYESGNGGIWHGSIDGLNLNLQKLELPGKQPLGIDYDSTTNKMYWAELDEATYRGAIKRASLDGSDEEILVPSPSESSESLIWPADIVIDKRLDKQDLYWIHNDINAIGGQKENRPSHVCIIEKAKLDGTLRTTIVPESHGLKLTLGLTFDPVENYLFWGDLQNAKIEKLKVDGSSEPIQTLVERPNIAWPSGIGIDLVDRRLYFCDQALDKIESVDLNGENPRTLYQSSSSTDAAFFGIGVHGNVIYVTDWEFTTLFRFNKYNGLEREAVAIGPENTEKVLRTPAIIHIHRDNPDDPRCTPCCLPAEEEEMPPLLVINPSHGTMLGGDILTITGACFPDSNGNINMVVCSFDGTDVKGDYDTGTGEATCVTPTLFKVGRISLDITFTTDDGTQHNYQGFFTMVSVEQINPGVVRVRSDEWWMASFSEYQLTWDPSSTKLADYVTNVKIGIYGYRENPIELAEIWASDEEIAFTNSTYTIPDLQLFSVPYTICVIKVFDSSAVDTSKSAALWSDVHSLQWLFPRQAIGCSQWNSNERTTFLNVFLNNQPPCPCELEQALLDFGGFSPLPECNQMENNCMGSFLFQNAIHCVRTSQPSSRGYGQECCYDEDGKITNVASNAVKPTGGFAHRNHHAGVFPYDSPGTVPYFSHFLNDLEPRMQCCVFNQGLCTDYSSVRPSSVACLYEAPPLGVGAGDPHLLTLDGTSYTFNGKGEYVMLEGNDGLQGNDFHLQARTDTLPNSDFAITVFVAVAAKYGSSDVVHVEVNQIRYLDVWVKEEENEWTRLNFEESTWWNLKGVSISAFNIPQSGVIVLFDGGVSVQLKVTDGDSRVMSVLFLGPESFKGHTKGLLGLWNDNPDDDLLTPSGTTVPVDSSIEDIHHQFGQTWQIAAADSLFYYAPLFGPDSFKDEDFVPVFETPTNPNVVPDEVTEACAGNEWCIFDFQATGNMEIAMASKESYEEQEAIVQAAMNVVICDTLVPPSHGHVSISRASVGGVATYSCAEGYMLMGMEQRVCQGNGRWFGSMPTCTKIPVIGPSSYSLEKSLHSVLESEKSVKITIKRSGDTQVAGSVRLSTLAATASSSTDFYLYINHVEFGVGVEKVDQYISIRNDDIREDLESFEIQLDEPVGSELGMPDMATVFIEDDEVEHFFRETAYTVSENAKSVQLTVQKVGYLGQTTVNFVTTDSTAKSSLDYIGQQGRVTFEPDKMTAYIQVSILDDNIYEDPEQFSVKLESSIPGEIGTRNLAVVNIDNDDELCFVRCENDGVCTDIDTCTCSSPAFYGRFCEKDSCIPTCENGGKCTAFSTCDCAEGYQGNRCETPVCIPACENGGTCTASNTCSCIASYTGSSCTETVCDPPCLNRGLCNEFHACTCPFEYTGNQCQELATNDCLVPNLCGGKEFQCIETMESYRCICANGYYIVGEQCLLASRVIVGEISVLEIDMVSLMYENAFMFPGSREYQMIEERILQVLLDIFRFAVAGFLEVKLRSITMGSIRVQYEVLLSEHTSSGSQDVLDALRRSTSPRGIVAGTNIKLDPFYTTIIEELCPADFCEEHMICRPDPATSTSVCLCPDGSPEDQCLENEDTNEDVSKDEFSVVTIISMGIVLIVLMVAVPVGIFFCYRLRRSRQLNTLGSNRDRLLYGSPQYQLPSVYWATGNSRVYTLPPNSRSNLNGHPWTLSPNASSNWNGNPWGNYI